MAGLLDQAGDLQKTIDTLTQMSSLTQQMADILHSTVAKFKGTTVDIAQLRDNIENFDDFLRPIRNYLYWEPHCFDIPVCWATRGRLRHARRNQHPDRPDTAKTSFPTWNDWTRCFLS